LACTTWMSRKSKNTFGLVTVGICPKQYLKFELHNILYTQCDNAIDHVVLSAYHLIFRCNYAM